MGGGARLLPRTIVPAVAALVVTAGMLLWWVRSAHSRAQTVVASERDRRPELHTPYAPEPIAIDAEEGKAVWQSETGSTGNLKDAQGKGMVPYTEVKARWRADTLYLLLYAGDLDLEGTVTEPEGPVSQDDSFHIELGGKDGTYVIEVSVLGTVADAACRGAPGPAVELTNAACDTKWSSHAKVAVDKDGTLNRIGDNDEEWVVEMAVPLDALGLRDARAGAHIPFAVRRCDIRHAPAPRVCGTWGMGEERGELIFAPRG